MPDFLERALTTLAFCWRVERRDGVCLGLTSHDRDLVIAGLVYRSAPGMLPSAVSVSDDFDASTLDVAGALTSDSIGEADLAAGRWDRAAVEAGFRFDVPVRFAEDRLSLSRATFEAGEIPSVPLIEVREG